MGDDMRPVLAIAAALLTCACMVTQVPLQSALVASATPSPLYKIAKAVTVSTAGADSLVLRAGTGWRKTGDIEHGAVYHTTDQVVIVNSFHVFEADIVVKDGKVVGFYNPVGKSFTKSTPAAITFNQESG
jgi:hypothetical protein